MFYFDRAFKADVVFYNVQVQTISDGLGSGWAVEALV